MATISYSYDSDGVRIKKKTANGILHTYFTEGTCIHHEKYGTHENRYYYDATGITKPIETSTELDFQAYLTPNSSFFSWLILVY